MEPKKPSILEALPPEILQYLSIEFLPSSSAACLSLTSKTLQQTLGTIHLKLLSRWHTSPNCSYPNNAKFHPKNPCSTCWSNPSNIQRYEFLKLIEKEYETQFFCEFCLRIHFSSHGEARPRTCDRDQPFFRGPWVKMEEFWPRGFAWGEVYLGMKNWRMGRLGEIGILVGHRKGISNPSLNYEWSTEHLIVDGTLLVKTTHTFLIPHQKIQELTQPNPINLTITQRKLENALQNLAIKNSIRNSHNTSLNNLASLRSAIFGIWNYELLRQKEDYREPEQRTLYSGFQYVTGNAFSQFEVTLKEMRDLVPADLKICAHDMNDKYRVVQKHIQRAISRFHVRDPSESLLRNIEVSNCQYDNREMEKEKEKIYTCNYCATEFRIEDIYRGKEGILMKVISYRDLGRCESPFDVKWQSHFMEVGDYFSFEKGPVKGGRQGERLGIGKKCERSTKRERGGGVWGGIGGRFEAERRGEV